jgi:hypothetical protein
MSPSHAIAPTIDQFHGVRRLISAVKQHRVFSSWAIRSRLKEELEKLDIRRSHTSDAPVWILVTLLAVAAGSATIGALTHKLEPQTAVGLAAAVLTVAGLLVAVLQWRHGLSEKAFDALYERIRLANSMWLEVCKELDSDEEPEFAGKPAERYRFWVFTEIDSLEYAARRYRFGLGMNTDIVGRAVRHFESRCNSELFCRTALACTGDTEAYFPETKKLVRSIVGRVRARRRAALRLMETPG